MKEDGNTHRTSLQILSELSKKYPHLIPDTLIHDIRKYYTIYWIRYLFYK